MQMIVFHNFLLKLSLEGCEGQSDLAGSAEARATRLTNSNMLMSDTQSLWRHLSPMERLYLLFCEMLCHLLIVRFHPSPQTRARSLAQIDYLLARATEHFGDHGIVQRQVIP